MSAGGKNEESVSGRARNGPHRCDWESAGVALERTRQPCSDRSCRDALKMLAPRLGRRIASSSPVFCRCETSCNLKRASSPMSLLGPAFFVNFLNAAVAAAERIGFYIQEISIWWLSAWRRLVRYLGEAFSEASKRSRRDYDSSRFGADDAITFGSSRRCRFIMLGATPVKFRWSCELGAEQ